MLNHHARVDAFLRGIGYDGRCSRGASGATGGICGGRGASGLVGRSGMGGHWRGERGTSWGGVGRRLLRSGARTRQGMSEGGNGTAHGHSVAINVGLLLPPSAPPPPPRRLFLGTAASHGTVPSGRRFKSGTPSTGARIHLSTLSTASCPSRRCAFTPCPPVKATVHTPVARHAPVSHLPRPVFKCRTLLPPFQLKLMRTPFHRKPPR